MKKTKHLFSAEQIDDVCSLDQNMNRLFKLIFASQRFSWSQFKKFTSTCKILVLHVVAFIKENIFLYFNHKTVAFSPSLSYFLSLLSSWLRVLTSAWAAWWLRVWKRPSSSILSSERSTGRCWSRGESDLHSNHALWVHTHTPQIEISENWLGLQRKRLNINFMTEEKHLLYFSPVPGKIILYQELKEHIQSVIILVFYVGKLLF